MSREELLEELREDGGSGALMTGGTVDSRIADAVEVLGEEIDGLEEKLELIQALAEGDSLVTVIDEFKEHLDDLDERVAVVENRLDNIEEQLKE